MADLPRPVTPGPWYSAESLETPVVMAKAHATRIASVHPFAASSDVWGADDDARAIAALPDWIAAHDALAARVAELEGVVEAVRRECGAHNRMPEGPPDRCCAQVFREGQADLARDLLALLPTEGDG